MAQDASVHQLYDWHIISKMNLVVFSAHRLLIQKFLFNLAVLSGNENALKKDDFRWKNKQTSIASVPY